jgi:hypothetical protein
MNSRDHPKSIIMHEGTSKSGSISRFVARFSGTGTLSKKPAEIAGPNDDASQKLLSEVSTGPRRLIPSSDRLHRRADTHIGR